jgi:hypothetical protein
MFSLALFSGMGIFGITQKVVNSVALTDAGSELAEIAGSLAIWRVSDKDDISKG